MMSGTTTEHVTRCLDRLNDGDPAARDELIAYASRRIRELATWELRRFGRLHGLVESDDVFQEAAMRLVRDLDCKAFESPLQFFWLTAKLIRDVLVDFVRTFFGRDGRRIRYPGTGGSPAGDEVEVVPAPVQHSPALDVIELRDCVDRLPEDQREVVDLLFYHGLSRQEAATLLEVSSKTVTRRFARAKINLQTMLERTLPGYRQAENEE